MTAICMGLFFGVTLGLSAAPLWMMLQLPIRACEIAKTAYNMRHSAWALALGAALGALSPTVFLPDIFGILVMLFGGAFTGMIAAALVETVEVIPVLYDRLSISVNMRTAALALSIGKGIGAFLACMKIGG